MNRVEKLNEELKRRGAEFTVREHEKWVNGVYYKGLMLWSSQNNINPIIYDAEILMDAELDTAVDKLIHFHEMTAEPPIEYEEMMNPDWFRKHLTIRLYSSRAKEHFAKEEVVYRDCLDMAMALYVFIPCSDEYSECGAAVHYDVLEELELTEQEAFEIAKKNIEKEVVYRSMELMMGELLTGEKMEFNEVDEEGMNVLTNTLVDENGNVIFTKKDCTYKYAFARWITDVYKTYFMLFVDAEGYATLVDVNGKVWSEGKSDNR